MDNRQLRKCTMGNRPLNKCTIDNCPFPVIDNSPLCKRTMGNRQLCKCTIGNRQLQFKRSRTLTDNGRELTFTTVCFLQLTTDHCANTQWAIDSCTNTQLTTDHCVNAQWAMDSCNLKEAEPQPTMALTRGGAGGCPPCSTGGRSFGVSRTETEGFS